jgi:hypothetical protein
LHDKNAKDVNENLAYHEKITKNFPVLSNEHIAHVVQDYSHEMGAACVPHQPLFIRVYE